MQTVPTVHPVNSDGISSQNYTEKTPFGAIPRADREAYLVLAREARQKQKEAWKELSLRQDFKDEAWMKAHIKAAGLHVPYYMEPATTHRLRSFLHKAGIPGVTVREAVGSTLGVYLESNRDLPLWAALALVIEATGLFTDKVSGISEEVAA